ncbi:hypothetical protein OA253_02375 [Alphaproteobacteria bacterium]|nr:hypothetical protein [Alphaproteobacteria bacterium]
MSKYCPTWIIDCIIAEASLDFIQLEIGLEFISKKYTEGIKSLYEDVENVNIYEGVKRVVELCVRNEINQNSNLILSQFSYYKFYFVNQKTQRNFSSLFSNPFESKMPRFLTEEDTIKNFYSFLKIYKNFKFVHYKEGWCLKRQEENEELKNLACEPLSEDILQTLGDVKKEQEFQSDWLKKK